MINGKQVRLNTWSKSSFIYLSLEDKLTVFDNDNKPFKFYSLENPFSEKWELFVSKAKTV